MQYLATFDMVHEHLPEPIPMRERTVYLPGDPAVFSIRMCDLPDVEPPLVWDYRPFLASVQVV